MFPPRLFYVYVLYLVLAFGLTKIISRYWQAKDIPTKTAQRVMFLVCVLQGLFYFLTYIYGYYNFSIGATDLTAFAQSLWNITHAQTPYLSVQETHFLRDHFSLIWYGIAQVFRLWPSIEWLVLLSTLHVAMAGYIVYAFSRNILKSEWLGLALGISYLINPYTQLGQIAAVHAESFTIVWLGFSLYALQQRKWLWFGIASAIAMLGKEDVGLYYVGVGVYLAMVEKKRWLGIITALTGFGWTVLALKVFMPHFGPDTIQLMQRFYGDLGNDLFSILKNIGLHPWLLITTLLTAEKIMTLFYLLAQTGFLVVLSGWAILPLGMAIGLKLLTNYSAMNHLWDHHSLHILPFFYFASALGVKYWLSHPRPALWRERIRLPKAIGPNVLALFLILLALLVNLERGNTPLSRKFSLKPYYVTEHNQLGAKLIKSIPAQASVLAQEWLAPHFAFRPEVTVVAPWRSWKIGEEPLSRPEYAVFDLEQAKQLTYQQQVIDTVEYFYSSDEYAVLKEQDGWVIFQRQVK
jgi:uncharacterized membrane protein